MKSILLAAVSFALLSACSMNSSTPYTAWGKQGVTLLDYRTDGAVCAALAASSNPNTNAANTAGGINGQNGGTPNSGTGNATAGAGAAAGGGANSGPSSAPVVTNGGGGAYRDSASADFVQRAAMQQRTQEMEAQRARNSALKSCLSGRGYTEFELNAEQRAQLAKLAPGSDERREYLYKLGTDPAVLSKAAVPAK